MRDTDFVRLPMLLKVNDLMVLLSLRRSAVYALLRSGIIPSVRVGKELCVMRSALRAYLEKTI